MSQNNYMLKFTPQAKSDLENIYSYIVLNLYAEESAIKIIADIETNIKRLKALPYSAPLYDEPQYLDFNIRKLVVKQYVVFYLINEDKKQVEVIHILHSRMDSAKALKT